MKIARAIRWGLGELLVRAGLQLMSEDGLSDLRSRITKEDEETFLGQDSDGPVPYPPVVFSDEAKAMVDAGRQAPAQAPSMPSVPLRGSLRERALRASGGR